MEIYTISMLASISCKVRNASERLIHLSNYFFSIQLSQLWWILPIDFYILQHWTTIKRSDCI